MCGDDRLDLAVLQARLVFLVKGGQVVGDVLRVHLVGALVLCVDLRELIRDSADCLGLQGGVQPEVGVRGSVVVVLGFTGLGIVVVVGGCWAQLDHLGEVKFVLGPGLFDRLVDRGLKALEVDHQVGLLQAGDLLWGQFQIMRFLAWQRQVCHVHLVSARFGGGILEGIEGDGDLGDARGSSAA